ncbi:MAG: NAD-dependent deacylase [Candidatus Syntrophosphaera sp.]|jgi:NAD-dependent deacetylase
MQISKDTRLLVLTGAGISAESGISTFRDSGGLWEKHRVEDVSTPGGFAKDPAKVWKFYKERYKQAQNAEPNSGHYALADLEAYLGDNFALITQNIDGLHTRAGSRRMIEMHGSMQKTLCSKCGTKCDLDKIDLDEDIPLCEKCGGFLRPDVVWFGEMPYRMQEIESLLHKCDVFMIVGTSGIVYPAAGFVMTAKYLGAKTMAVNLSSVENRGFIDEFHQGKAGEILPSLVGEWTGKAAK